LSQEFLAQEALSQEGLAQEGPLSGEDGYVPAVSFSQSPEDFFRELEQEGIKEPEIFEFAPGKSFGDLIASDRIGLFDFGEGPKEADPEKSPGIYPFRGGGRLEGDRFEAEALALEAAEFFKGFPAKSGEAMDLSDLSSDLRGLFGQGPPPEEEGRPGPGDGGAGQAPMPRQAPTPGQAPAPGQAPDASDDLFDREVTSRSVIFSILRRGRESLFRELEAGPIPELGQLRQLAENFELALGWALSRIEAAAREAFRSLFGGPEGSLKSLPWPPEASQALGRLAFDLETALSAFSKMIRKRAEEFDLAAALVAWRAYALGRLGQIPESEASRLAALSKLGLESFCQDLFSFITTARELLTLCLMDAFGLFGPGPAPEPSGGGRGLLSGAKASPKAIESSLGDLRRALGKLAVSFSLLADQSLPGRLRVLVAARRAAAFDWLELEGALKAMETRLISLHRLAVIRGTGHCPGPAQDIRRLIEFGPRRLCLSLMRALGSLARIWEILRSFSRES
jgi:hypothetical protein